MTVFRQESSLQNGQISTRMVGNSQSSSLPARHDEMNNSVSRPNNHFVKSDTNSGEHSKNNSPVFT
ncbi:9971_t:CDS:1, partial [Scutellospora calospora]